ncbi:MAG: GldG family protein [Bryobacterales bacterium]|nr:GldG family protein [Bryobacterales bacterium]
MRFFSSRQSKFGTYAVTYTLIVIAVLAGINWLANQRNKSMDFTSNKRFSLSDQTIKIVSGLKQDVTVSYFDETSRFAQAKDLLDRYGNLSPKLHVEYIDPVKKPQLARQYGVRTMGTTLLRTSAKSQEARSLSEEEVTSALIRLLKEGQKTACFTAGAGEHSLDETGPNGYSGAKDLLEKNNYKTQTVNLLEKPEIPKECGIVVVAGPHVDYPQAVVDTLKKFVESGGDALFMLDPPIDSGKDRIAENPALMKLMDDLGVTLNKDQVLDTSGIGGLYGLGPEVALASRYESQPIVRDMKGTATAFAIARSLTVNGTKDKASAEKIISSSPNSFATTQLSGKERKIDVSKGKQDSFVLAAAGTYRTGQPDHDGRYVIVGSSDWAANYVLRFAGNRDLFVNMMNWLSNDEDLISIRPKDPEDRRIQMTRGQMSMLRLTAQFLLPLLVIVAGIMVWLRRR